MRAYGLPHRDKTEAPTREEAENIRKAPAGVQERGKSDVLGWQHEWREVDRFETYLYNTRLGEEKQIKQ